MSKGTRQVLRRTVATMLLTGLAWIAASGFASAAGPQGVVLLVVTEDAELGRQAELVARVVGPEGVPLEGVQVTFLAEVEFLNTFSNAVIGEATTDEAGVARLHYVPSVSGEIPITARAGGLEDPDAIETSGTLSVSPGPPVFEPESPIRIPGANVWLVVGALTAVWSVYLWMMWLLQQISADDEPELFGLGGR